MASDDEMVEEQILDDQQQELIYKVRDVNNEIAETFRATGEQDRRLPNDDTIIQNSKDKRRTRVSMALNSMTLHNAYEPSGTPLGITSTKEPAKTLETADRLRLRVSALDDLIANGAFNKPINGQIIPQNAQQTFKGVSAQIAALGPDDPQGVLKEISKLTPAAKATELKSAKPAEQQRQADAVQTFNTSAQAAIQKITTDYGVPAANIDLNQLKQIALAKHSGMTAMSMAIAANKIGRTSQKGLLANDYDLGNLDLGNLDLSNFALENVSQQATPESEINFDPGDDFTLEYPAGTQELAATNPPSQIANQAELTTAYVEALNTPGMDRDSILYHELSTDAMQALNQGATTYFNSLTDAEKDTVAQQARDHLSQEAPAIAPGRAADEAEANRFFHQAIQTAANARQQTLGEQGTLTEPATQHARAAAASAPVVPTPAVARTESPVQFDNDSVGSPASPAHSTTSAGGSETVTTQEDRERRSNARKRGRDAGTSAGAGTGEQPIHRLGGTRRAAVPSPQNPPEQRRSKRNRTQNKPINYSTLGGKKETSEKSAANKRTRRAKDRDRKREGRGGL